MNKAYSEIDPSTLPGRYEIKMVYDGLDYGTVRSLILRHSHLFKQAYPPRQVNNIYFDSPDFQLQFAHTQGLQRRFKIRLRWYHPSWIVSGGALEIKSKYGSLGQKGVIPLSANLDLNEQSWHEILSVIGRELSPGIDSTFKATRPVLINFYQREYFRSANHLIRITLDRELHALDQRFGSRPNLTGYLPTRNLAILEVKADRSQYKSLADVLAEFPTYCSAYSKYIQGLDNALG